MLVLIGVILHVLKCVFSRRGGCVGACLGVGALWIKAVRLALRTAAPKGRGLSRSMAAYSLSLLDLS